MSKNNKNFQEQIFNENLDKLISDKFGKYSKYIIQERALPDLRDGLKPVQRRILFAMNELKLTHNSSYKKSARIVGDVIGKYHPHGDTSVYEAMVRLGQDWKLNIPLIDMHGNKGSIDGDGPAAMRYTETRLGKISQYLLTNISKSLTPFTMNFDDSELEPVVLPALFPNLLVNGATGIAAGYATNIPPHNIVEVIKALIYVLQNPEEIKLSQITKYIKGPDFPTGGLVFSSDSIKEAYKTGKGKLVIRSKIEHNEKDREILITEIPYETNKAEIVKEIDEYIREGKLPSLKEVRDDSDRKGLQITITTKAEINLDATLNFLFKNTSLQKNYSINMVAIKDKKPQLLSLADILISFSNFQIEIYTKLFKFELDKLSSRNHIIDGLIQAVKNIDKVIKEIRASKNKSDAKERLIKVLNITETQAEAIVNLRLYRLSSTDIDDLINENNEVLKLISHYTKGLKDKGYLISNIVDQLNIILKEFNIPRRTQLESEIEEIVIDEKALLQEENVHVTISKNGYIKRTSIKSKETSSEDSLGIREDDVVISSFEISNMKNILLFTSTGRYFTIPVYKIKESKWKDIGEHIGKYFSVLGEEEIISVYEAENFNFQGLLLVSTSKGLIKATNINELSHTNTKKGSKYINVKAGDKVCSINILCNESNVLSVSKFGKIIKFNSSSVPIIGLSAAGVRNMNLEEGDEIVSTIIENKSENLIILTNEGRIKSFKSNEVKETSRGGKGVAIFKPSKTLGSSLIGLFVKENIEKLNILSNEKEHISFKQNNNLLSLSKEWSIISKNGIKQSSNEYLGNFGKCKNISKKETKITEPTPNLKKEEKIKLKNILDEL